MAFNLMDLAKGYLTDAIIGKVSENLGENPSGISSAIGAALPSVLGGLIKSSTSPSGLSGIMNVLKDQDSGMLDNLSDILGNSQKSSGLMDAGGNLLSGLLGNNLGNIINVVSSIGGIKNSSASSLLGLVGPVLMGVLGKKVKSEGLGLSGLGSLLSSQSDLVSKALPAGMAGTLGLDNLMSMGRNTANAASKHTEEVIETAGGFNWKPWLIGLLAALALWFGFKQCSGSATNAVEEVTTSVEDAASKASDMVDSAASGLGSFLARKLPNGVELNVPENGIESNLISFISDASANLDENKWFNFDRINFATGSSNLTDESMEQVKNIAEILKAFPNVKLKIGGYTDNTGNAASNLKLSGDRSTTVMNAIVAEGIDAGRLASEGYGDQHPVATNDTEEGRAQNRRIAVRVNEK